jgi:hypothetical protein
MTLEQFARKHHAKISTRRDDGTREIAGRRGQIYEYSDGELGVMFISSRHSARTWCNRKREALAAGMTLRQDGDAEGALSFDPLSITQGKLALRIAKVRKPVMLSDADRAVRQQRMERLNARKNGPLTAHECADEGRA